MKKNLFFLWALIAAFSLVMTSCNDDDDDNDDPTPTINEAELLVNYLESTASPYGKDYANVDLPSIMPASEVKTLNETGQVYIMDIRAQADFDAGHIENAVLVAPGDALTHLQGVDLTPYTKVAVVCYTGQTAGWVTTLLRIMGYDKAFSMKWGMCSWHDDFAGKWNSNVGSTYSTQFTADVTNKGAAGELPELNTGESDPQAILEARVNAVLAEGFGAAKVTGAEVFGNLTGYYIVNYWPEAHYLDPGHIPGAMQYTPKASMASTADLMTLPTDKTVVVYCYTGQTSAFMSAYLRVLGYDAKSLLFGCNSMIWDDMETAGLTVWKADNIMGYDYVPTK